MNDISPGLRARVLLEKHGFQTAHALGQNFLLDENLLSHLIDLSGVAGEDEVLEIGPGPGLMTCLLARRARSVTAVELDRRLEPVLSSMLEGCENARVLYADALRDRPFRPSPPPGARVVANLPYYITADVVTRLLLRGAGYESIAVMVQKEAAERMTSLPGDKQWCHLAALVRYFGKPRILEEIPPEAFEPSPHVVSAFLRIDLYDERPVRPNDEALFLRVLAAAFAHAPQDAAKTTCAPPFPSPPKPPRRPSGAPAFPSACAAKPCRWRALPASPTRWGKCRKCKHSAAGRIASRRLLCAFPLRFSPLKPPPNRRLGEFFPEKKKLSRNFPSHPKKRHIFFHCAYSICFDFAL